MNRIGFALATLAVVISAAWAYHVNYDTKTALGRVEGLRKEIASEREAVEVLRVESAYLNAPARLARLVQAHNTSLGLEPLSPQAFDEVAMIPYPPRGPQQGSEDASPEEQQRAAVQLLLERVLLAADRVPMPTPRPVVWTSQ